MVRPVGLIGLMMSLSATVPAAAQATVPADSLSLGSALPADSLQRDSAVSHPWRAAAAVTAVNTLVMAYDHLFMSDMACYRVTLRDIGENFKLKNWWWDSDHFHTNAINHPYHGSLYYTAARSQGVGVGTASLLTLGGSLTWELLCEAEPPSYNDLIATTVGGIALGEPMHRVSDAIIDNSCSGLERVGRELLAAVVNPVKAVSRLLRGDLWRKSPRSLRQSSVPLSGTVEIGMRRQNVYGKPAFNTAYASLDMTYGDILGTNGHRPFDYFTLRLTVVEGSRQPRINNVQVKSQIWSHPIEPHASTHSERSSQLAAVVGLYQHFDYHSAAPAYQLAGEQRYKYPYGYLEVGAVGPGVALRTGSRVNFEQQLFVNAIALGATPSETTHKPAVSNRNYSFGSGYGARLTSILSAGSWFKASVNASFSQLFCWDGFYADDPDRQRSSTWYSVQGEEGNAVTLTAEPSLLVTPVAHWGVAVHGRYFWCHNNYRHHPHDTTHSWEFSVGICYSF